MFHVPSVVDKIDRNNSNMVKDMIVDYVKLLLSIVNAHNVIAKIITWIIIL